MTATERAEAEKPRANADRSQVRQERESRLDDLAKCSGGHDTRHYYGWLYDISDLERENAALAEHIREIDGSTSEYSWPEIRREVKRLAAENADLKTALSGKTFDDAEYQRGRTEAAEIADQIIGSNMVLRGSLREARAAIRDHFKLPAVTIRGLESNAK